MTIRPPARAAAVAAFAALGLLAAPAAVAEATDSPCGPLHTQHYGPFDYRTQHQRLEIVEFAHFTPRVEALIGGSTGDLGPDLNYTLLASPNHHRALISVARWSDKVKVRQLPKMDYPVECYYERGVRFAPDDTIVRVLYARFLGKQGRKPDALAQLQAARYHAGDNPLTHYNIGLAYFDLGAFTDALQEAQLAKQQGYLRPELEDQLRKAGQWRDPVDSAGEKVDKTETADKPGKG